MKRILILLLCSFSFLANAQTRVTAANAYNRESAFTANSRVATDDFVFDYMVAGQLTRAGRTYNATYHVNTRDGSILINEKQLVLFNGVMPRDDEDKFQFAVIYTDGRVTQYWITPENEKKAITTRLKSTAGVTRSYEHSSGTYTYSQREIAEAGNFEQYRLQASKTNMSAHRRYGPQKLHNGRLRGIRDRSANIKMTISNRGVNIPISPYRVGFMAGIFKDEIQKINRVITKFEIPGQFTMTINHISPDRVTYSGRGYEVENTPEADFVGDNGTVRMRDVVPETEGVNPEMMNREIPNFNPALTDLMKQMKALGEESRQIDSRYNCDDMRAGSNARKVCEQNRSRAQRSIDERMQPIERQMRELTNMTDE